MAQKINQFLIIKDIFCVSASIFQFILAVRKRTFVQDSIRRTRQRIAYIRRAVFRQSERAMVADVNCVHVDIIIRPVRYRILIQRCTSTVADTVHINLEIARTATRNRTTVVRTATRQILIRSVRERRCRFRFR